MVRLKDQCATVPFFFTLFQFQYGSIKRKIISFRTQKQQHFNSNMVRLKVLEAGVKAVEMGNFNSNMVRLKEWCCIVSPFCLAISIPIWFD